MAPPSSGRTTSAADAIRDVFGPGRTIVAWSCIVAGGLAGLALAGSVGQTGENAREWLRTFACIGYGIAAGALIAILPFAWRVAQLNATLSRRPSAEAASDPQRTWWPLRLVAAALRNTPLLRMTSQDFAAATSGWAVEVRGIVSRRLWPACAAAFAAPVFGLVSAWLTWGRSIDAAAKAPVDARAVPLGVVAWPMIFTILAGLTVMLGVVLVDQMVRALLQRWSTVVTLLDADAPAVREHLAEPLLPTVPAGPTAMPAGAFASPASTAPPPTAVPAKPPAEERSLTAGDLQGLDDLFRNG